MAREYGRGKENRTCHLLIIISMQGKDVVHHLFLAAADGGAKRSSTYRAVEIVVCCNL